MPRKIVAIGPESTGKSTLCEQLAQYYDTLWCPEYAREYLSTHGSKYDYNDLLAIARGQLALEEEYTKMASEGRQIIHKEKGVLRPSNLLFIDTNMYVMKVWCEFVFGKCHRFILNQIAKRKYDLYLLCDVDMEWSPDKLREYPDIETRNRVFQIYKHIMVNQSVPWVLINGDKKQRLQSAIHAVDGLFRE